MHLIFILATTEAHKIPATILSRCQHFIFRRIPRIEIETQLRKILSEKNIQMPDCVVTFIAKASEGSLRDALSLFDQAISYSGKNVTEEDLSTLFGRAAGTTFHSMVLGIAKKDADALLGISREIENGGYDLRQFLSDWIEHIRNLIVIKNVKDVSLLIDLPGEVIKEIEKEAGFFSQSEMLSLFAIFVKLQDEIRNAPRPHLLLEVALMKAVLLADLTPIEKIIADLQEKEAPAVSTMSALVGPLKEMTRADPPLQVVGVTAPIGVVPLQEATALWKNLLQDVKKTRPNLASYLDQGVLMAASERTIKIGFSEESSFLISLIEKEENKKLLQPLLKSYFKRDVGLTLEAMNGQRESFHPKDVDCKDTSTVEEALRVFGGEIVKT